MAISTSLVLKFSGAAVQKGLAGIKKGFTSMASVGKSALSSMLGPTAKLAAMLGPSAIAVGIGKLMTGASETASNFEQMRTSFVMFTCTMEGAVKLMDQLRKVDIVSNLDLETLGQGAKTLMAYGTKAEDVSGIIEKLSKISGGSADKFEGLALAFGQTTQNMSLKGDDLRQYVERGWNPLEQIMKKTGETAVQVQARMRQHKVTLDEIKWAMNDVTSGTGRFAKAHELGAKTFLAATSRMQSQWALLQDAFGTPLNTHLGAVFDSITSKLPQLQQGAKDLGEQFGKILSATWNSVGNGEFGTLVKDAFMSGVTTAGKYIIGALAFAGNLLTNKLKEAAAALYKVSMNSTAGKLSLMTESGKAEFNANMDMLKPNDLSFSDAVETGGQMLNTDHYQKTFQDTLQRNQDGLVPMKQPSNEGASSAMLSAIREMIDQQKKTNINLAPQP